MINFLVCDDNKIFLQNVIEIINNFMMNNDLEFKIYSYNNIRNDIKEDIKRIKGFKIYILDIEIEDESGIEFSRYIREELDDWNSFIILLTVHNELKYEVLGKRLFIFDFINKYDSYKKILIDDLVKIIKNYENSEKKFCYKENRILKLVLYNDILYFEKIKNTNSVYLHIIDNKLKINEGISNIMKRLDNRFIKIDRSMIINKNKVIEYDINNNFLILSNGTKIYDLTKRVKRELDK